MTQHVVPFWLAFGVLFLIITELFYFSFIRNQRRSSSLGEFAVGMNFLSMFFAILVFAGIFIVGIIIEILAGIIVPILIIVGVAGLIIGYFYIKYLFAKKYAKSYEFKKGDKLKLVDTKGLMPSALVKTPEGSTMVCLERLKDSHAYRLKTNKGIIVERKEWRLDKA